ncbi:type I polyketide synthase [Streptomyces sp. NPDC001941]|uniref:type I polyketide synthase n=1 Tax=Streptomyces sp. NPDC001941 TaxID=3154659 RepID=UPI003319CA9D
MTTAPDRQPGGAGTPENAVAVVGMALRVAGADHPDAFWANLLAGKVTLPAGLADGPLEGRLEAGRIDRFREFDAELFGMLPAQAAATDPQHRVLTELAWEALEAAGLDTLRSTDKVGVFVGSGPDAYLHDHVLRDPAVVRALGEDQLRLGNSRDYLAAALSYRLGLTGPSLTVQSACSTSLVAVHQAVRSLLTYECDIALAGACTVHPADEPGYSYVEGGIVSPDGRCRSFTEGSNGTVPASGAGLVVLRRAEDAAADGTGRARALVLGSAVNNDGAQRMSLTSPSPVGQAEVIREALDSAGLRPRDIGYVETHGTGTALGDQVELSALAEVYGESTAPRLALGSVKPNVGHCDTAAGVVGLIKTVLAVERGTLPPTPSQPGDGPDAPLGSPRFRLPRAPEPWDGDVPRVAAVSSFGLGGTNAHLVVGPAAADPAPDPAEGDPGHRVAVLSAATPQALRDKRLHLADWLEGPGAHTALTDVLGTLWHGRRALGHRTTAVLSGDDALARAELVRALRESGTAPAAAADPRIAVVLPGQGTRIAGAGRELASTDPLFADDLVALAGAVLDADGPDLRDAAHWDPEDPRFLDTAVVQPLLFVLGLAALRLLERSGADLGPLLGHSVGELTAATHAGVFSVADGAAAVVRRGALMGRAPRGAMLAVGTGEDAARSLIADLPADVCVLNAPDSTVIGADEDTVEEVARRCAAAGVSSRRLATAHAFHSRAMEEAATGFEKFLTGLSLSAPRLTVLSNLTGGVLSAEDACDPGYWGRQLRGTVRFDDAVRTLAAVAPHLVIGTHRGPATTDPVRQELRRAGVAAPVVDLLGSRSRPEALGHQDVLAALWSAGCRVDLGVPRPRRTAALPAYPFAPTRHWIDAPPAGEPAPAAARAVPVSAPPAADTTDSAPGEAETPVEESGDVARTVREIWQAAFGGPALRPEDNFFTLGGTSLQAAHLLTQVNEALLVNASLSDLYGNSELGTFTARIQELLTVRDDDELLQLLREIEADQ